MHLFTDKVQSKYFKSAYALEPLPWLHSGVLAESLFLVSVGAPVDSVRDEHDVLVPRHELPLARGAADDQPLHTILNLHQAMPVGYRT